jgi:para-nitrobenzyl esterase
MASGLRLAALAVAMASAAAVMKRTRPSVFPEIDGAQDEALVNTPLGPVQGAVLTNQAGHSFRLFMGMPYAQPPVGDLRWAPPAAPTPWSGT